MKNISICGVLYVVIALFAGCGDGSKKDTQELNDRWKELEGKWAPYISFSDPDHNITSSYAAEFSKDALTIHKTCRRSDKLFVHIYGTIPFGLTDGIISFKKSIDFKVPFKIKNNQVELPKDKEDIKNFPVDKDTLYCDLSVETGDWNYQITNRDESRVLEISRPNDEFTTHVFGSFIRKK
ncbi:MAG TPA: hypothetical protein VEL47_06725 [Myxococcota bacterium]|nr:hypothetical protein [Myxococcota bacterium]